MQFNILFAFRAFENNSNLAKCNIAKVNARRQSFVKLLKFSSTLRRFAASITTPMQFPGDWSFFFFFCPVLRAQAEMQPICKVDSRQKVVIAKKNSVWQNNMDGKKKLQEEYFLNLKMQFLDDFFFYSFISFIYVYRLQTM